MVPLLGQQYTTLSKVVNIRLWLVVYSLQDGDRSASAYALVLRWIEYSYSCSSVDVRLTFMVVKELPRIRRRYGGYNCQCVSKYLIHFGGPVQFILLYDTQNIDPMWCIPSWLVTIIAPLGAAGKLFH